MYKVFKFNSQIARSENRTSKQKNGQWWRTVLIPALGRQRQADF
jgi:hypothetical protein